MSPPPSGRGAALLRTALFPTAHFRTAVAVAVIALSGLPISPVPALGPAPAAAQLAPPESGPPDALPAEPTAYLVTIGRGRAIWERFGHNLLWIWEPGAQLQEGYNYGLFSFDEPGFLVRFVRGHMDYWMAGLDLDAQLSAYAGDGRSVEIQELDLNPDQVAELRGFLESNELPENRFYRYQYYRDNCSTRVRDALDRVMDGRLRGWAESRVTDASYRDHTLRQADGLFWINVGMHFGLGPSVDRPLTAWEGMFIPMEMRDHLLEMPGEATPGASMIRRQWTVAEGAFPAAPGETPRWLGPFAVLGLAAAALVLGSAVLARAGRRWAGWATRGLGIPVLALFGALGMLITLLWAFTDHVDTQGNVTLLQANPLHLAVAVLWGVAAATGRARGILFRTAVVVAALSLLGLGLQGVGAIHQVNGEWLLFLVPLNLSVAGAIWWWEARGAHPSPEHDRESVSAPS